MTTTTNDNLYLTCLSARGDAAQDLALRSGIDVRETRDAEERHESYLLHYGQASRAQLAARADYWAAARPRRVGAGGETRCGDLLGEHGRRLCGGCSQPDGQPDGCGEVLGYSPDEIVVGPGGQTLAQAAEDERWSPALRGDSTAYAVVLPPPDGRPILLRPNLVRYGYDLWPAGFAGEVVGLIVDAGTGTTEADIRAALTVTVLDPVFAADVAGCATDHVWCEMDRLRAEAERAAGEPLTD